VAAARESREAKNNSIATASWLASKTIGAHFMAILFSLGHWNGIGSLHLLARAKSCLLVLTKE